MEMPIIEPRDAAAPVPAVDPNAAPEPAPATEGPLPEPLLKIPALQAVMAGAPPAVSTNIEAFKNNPAFKPISDSKDVLQQAGVNFYRSLSGDIGVIFNQLKIHLEDLQAADKMGKLTTIAPP